MPLCEKREGLKLTRAHTGPPEPQSSGFHQEAKQGRLQVLGAWGDGEVRAESTALQDGWKQTRSDSGKAAPEGHSSSGYTHGVSSALPTRATFTMEVVHQARRGGKGQPPRPHPNLSPRSTGSAGTASPNINKGPFSPKAKLEQQRPADSEDGAGGGTDESGEGKGIKPEGAEARRSGKQKRRGGGRGNPQRTMRRGGRRGPGLRFPRYPLPGAERAPVLAVYISSASGTAQPEFGEGKGRGIFRPDHNSLPPARSRRQQPPQRQPHKGAFLVLPAPSGRRLQRRQGRDDHRSAPGRSLALFPF